MKPKLIALNLLLVAGIAAIVWRGRIEWDHSQMTRRQNLNTQVKPLTVAPPAPAAKPDPAQPARYADVATKDLFAKDRNPNVIIEPVKVEAPKPMPPLPVIYGVLGLPSGTKAIMAEKKGAAGRPVRQGDSVGEFKIASLDTKSVAFDWNGQQITRSVDELMDRSGGVAPAAAAGPAGAPAAGPAVAAAAAPANRQPGTGPGPGIPIPGGKDRTCVPGDTAPKGTVSGGYKLDYDADTPFGRYGCHWSPVQ